MNPSPAQPSAQSPLTATPTPPRIASPQFAVPQMRAFRPRPSRAPPPAPINGPRGLWRVGGYTVQKHEINMRSSPITRTCLRQSLNHALDVRNPSLHHLGQPRRLMSGGTSAWPIRTTMPAPPRVTLLDVTLSRVTQSGDPSPGMRIPGSHRGIRACIPDEVSATRVD